MLHQSQDGLWYYVQSYSDMGWVPVESVALVSTKEEWRRYGEGAVLVVTGNRMQLGANPYTQEFSQKERGWEPPSSGGRGRRPQDD